MHLEPPALTVLRLHPDDPLTASTWRDTHLAHATVMAAADGHNGTRVLWARPTPTLLLIQAAQPATHAGFRAQHTCRPVTVDWPAGARVRFGLIGNPTIRPSDRATARNRVPLPPGERDDWLRRKLAPALTITCLTGHQLGTRAGRRGGGRVAHLQHAWTGQATVHDPGELAGLIVSGVGPAKGYGCGLLLVRGDA